MIGLSLGLALGLVGNVLALFVNGVVGVLDKLLVSLLGILLAADRFSLHGLRIIDDLLDHAHHTTSSGILFVLGKPGRGRRTCRLSAAGLEQSSLLGIEALE